MVSTYPAVIAALPIPGDAEVTRTVRMPPFDKPAAGRTRPGRKLGENPMKDALRVKLMLQIALITAGRSSD